MHRGSSKDAGTPSPAPESLPLSASPPTPLRLRVEIRRGGASDRRSVEVAPHTTVRGLLALLGQPSEGSAVWLDGEPVPLDTPLEAQQEALVVPTFSGG